tara:strand:+ start:198 stop:704 length:507 start_codon:yes stop_codon:yes gene_type:complete
MSNHIKEQILSITLQVNLRDLTKTKNIDGFLLYNLKKRLEKKCGECGYVIENSISIVERSHGIYKTIDNKSIVQYEINYKVRTIHPQKDEIYECIVDSITKMGVISYLSLNDDDTIENTPLLIIIPKDYISDDRFEKIEKGKKIKIKILDSRMKHLADKIQSVGQLDD